RPWALCAGNARCRYATLCLGRSIVRRGLTKGFRCAELVGSLPVADRLVHIPVPRLRGALADMPTLASDGSVREPFDADWMSANRGGLGGLARTSVCPLPPHTATDRPNAGGLMNEHLRQE